MRDGQSTTGRAKCLLLMLAKSTNAELRAIKGVAARSASTLEKSQGPNPNW
ncbi:MAG: hypothetical protein AVDCRST_MAG91-1939 [uncultured Sphingomonadaceae bacterium]|uniref:Uncharacterized protein n=1 Tax=uncultured Sphingomonadaceae bacterium TaxID=169976 RepID=A0A6J4T8F7_9SPHN|nr:MAG: hypothetical protein AVDCRST_MAG91-1939 [uncultured Sphingomonadaceae bacterium]